MDPWDTRDLERALERALDRLDAATVKAEQARRAHFWGMRPASETRQAYHEAMREEADAALAVEAARRALARARREPASGGVGADA